MEVSLLRALRRAGLVVGKTAGVLIVGFTPMKNAVGPANSLDPLSLGDQ